MRTITVKVENLKCKGCAKTIRNGLTSYNEVKTIGIDIEKSEISIEFDGDESNVKKYETKLRKMGYPQQGDNNTISVAKSFVSCAIGRVSK